MNKSIFSNRFAQLALSFVMFVFILVLMPSQANAQSLTAEAVPVNQVPQSVLNELADDLKDLVAQAEANPNLTSSQKEARRIFYKTIYSYRQKGVELAASIDATYNLLNQGKYEWKMDGSVDLQVIRQEAEDNLL